MKDISIFIDTTNHYCAVAIFDGKNIIDNIKLEVNKNVTDLIVTSIENLFLKNKINVNSIMKIYLNVGPGTFTGVRVGVLVAKAIKMLNNKINIFTCDSLTLQMEKLDGVSYIDAKTNLFYYAKYKKNNLFEAPSIISSEKINAIKNKKNFNVETCNWDKWINKISSFKKTNINKLTPLYLKKPI